MCNFFVGQYNPNGQIDVAGSSYAKANYRHGGNDYAPTQKSGYGDSNKFYDEEDDEY